MSEDNGDPFNKSSAAYIGEREEAMSREIITHRTNACNEAIEIVAYDGSGGGYDYRIEWPDCVKDEPGEGHDGGNFTHIKFQNGPIAEVGTNGATIESLLAVVIDRLRVHQLDLKFATRENALAITKLEEATHWLRARTDSRKARGVEGTHTP